MMNCPQCGCHSKVYDSRFLAAKASVYRRRICQKCEHRWTTTETTDATARTAPEPTDIEACREIARLARIMLERATLADSTSGR